MDIAFGHVWRTVVSAIETVRQSQGRGVFWREPAESVGQTFAGQWRVGRSLREGKFSARCKVQQKRRGARTGDKSILLSTRLVKSADFSAPKNRSL